MAENNGKVMPHNIEAEEALLGSILIDNEINVDIMPVAKETDFYSETNRIVYKAMQKVYERNQPIDLVTLADELDNDNNLTKIGGLEQLTRFTSIIPSSANFKHYLNIVKRDALRRTLIHSSQEIIEQSLNIDEDLDVLSFAEGKIFDISQKNENKFPSPIGESFNEVIDKFEKISLDADAFRGLTTGLKGLNDKLNGLQRSDLVLIAARPAEGKTSFAMNLVENAALLGGATCLCFSLEMGKAQLAQRMLCSHAKVKMERALKGELDDKEWARLWKAKNELANSRILIDDTASITPADMMSKCKRVKAKYGLDVIMVDYIQLMGATGKHDNRQQEITNISRGLKLIAREMNCTVLALSQLSRSIETRNPPLPMLSDLRDSGAIEQDADIVLFIYDPSKAVKTDKSDNSALTGAGNSGIKQIIIAKHRNGPTGHVDLRWIGEYVRFEDPDGVVKVERADTSRNTNQQIDPQELNEVFGNDMPEPRQGGNANVDENHDDIMGEVAGGYPDEEFDDNIPMSAIMGDDNIPPTDSEFFEEGLPFDMDDEPSNEV